MTDISQDAQSGCPTDHAIGFRQDQTSTPLSIATPAVTQINENLTDALFLHPPHSYHHEETTVETNQNLNHSASQPTFISPPESSARSMDQSREDNQTQGASISFSTDSGDGSNPVSAQAEDGKEAIKSKNCPKKKSKTSKKGLKLDTKSKLEKSRQSARECRARKKLRYQYLEDLVCNREKAVFKLREELTMFCKMSEQLDSGTISKTDRNFLVEQTKENSVTVKPTGE